MATADRILSVLALFTLSEPEWTVERAAERIGASSSTVYRYFNSLSAAGLIESLRSGVYLLGPAIVELDRQVRLLDPLSRVARPVLQRLLSMTQNKGIGLLCRRYRQQVMCVHQEFAGEHEPHVSYERGRPMDLFRGAASQVILAHVPTRTLKSLYEAKPDEVAAAGLGDSWMDFRASLKNIRAAGVHQTWGQLDIGKVGISSPVLLSDDTVIGSVSLVLDEADCDAPMLARVSTLVRAAGKEIEAALVIDAPKPAPRVTPTPVFDSQAKVQAKELSPSHV